MRTYEFTPYQDQESTVFAIRIDETRNDVVSTFWRDFGRHLVKGKQSLNETEAQNCQKFQRQLSNFWKTVCRMESKYNSGMVDAIIASVADPDLREFLVQNS